MATTSTAMRRVHCAGRRKPEQDRFFHDALDSARWVEGDAEHWDTWWHTGMPPPRVFRATAPGRTVNHIPGNNSLTIKSRLYRTVRATRDRMLARHAPDSEAVRRTEFLPAVYEMPRDYHAFQADAHAAPQRRWLLKPKNSARGKGIRLIDDPAEIPGDASWMVQPYVDNPHLMDGRKYVLRLYVVISSIEPLRVYLYHQGFAKLASAPYTLDDTSNVYAHLTNPDVNARNTEAEAPVVFVDFERYRAWLREQGHDDARLFERIRDLVAITAISAREPMRRQSRKVGADPRGCYELLGMDCLIDDRLDPWLLECNLSPSLEVCAAPADGGDIETGIKRDLVADMVALLDLNGDSATAPGSGDPAADIVARAETENARAGGFERVYPVADAERYLDYFPCPRLADIVLADAVAGRRLERPTMARWQASEIIDDDRLSLFNTADATLSETNPTAALIWLQAVDGADPERIAEALAGAAGADSPSSWQIRAQVWDALADWATAGLLVQAAAPDAAIATGTGSAAAVAHDAGAAAAAEPVRLRAGVADIELLIQDPTARRRLEPLLEPLRASTAGPTAPGRLEVATAEGGFSVVRDGELVAHRVPLGELGPWLFEELMRTAPGPGEIALPGCLLPGAAGQAAMLVCPAESTDDDAVALCVDGAGHGLLGAGCRIDIESEGRVRPLALPLRVGADDLDRVRTRCAAPAEARLPVWQSRCRTHLLAGRPTGDAPAPEQVGVVVLPRRTEAAGGTGTLTRVTVHEALRELLPRIRTASGDRPDADTVASLVEWLRARDLFSIDANDPLSAADTLAAGFGDGASTPHGMTAG